MATALYLRSGQTKVSGYYDLETTAGASPDTAVVNTAASATQVQFTKTAGGSVVSFISDPVSAFTLTSTDISIYAYENNSKANVGGRYRLFKYSLGTETELGGGPFDDGVEFSVTPTITNYTWAGNVTDTAFATYDRIVLKVYITNVGTMAATYTATLFFNGNSGTDVSVLNTNETITFVAPVDAPTVTTQACSNVTETSFDGNGNITDTGGVNAAIRGFCYYAGSSGDPSLTDGGVVSETGDYGTGAFSLTIEN